MKKPLMSAGLLAAVLTLAGCEPSTKNVTAEFVLPPELAHCTIYRMFDGSNHVRVVYCPQGTTTTLYNSGKSSQSITVINP